MSRIIIPLGNGREVSFKVRPPDDSLVVCAAPGCGNPLPRFMAWSITATVTQRLTDTIVEVNECFACNQSCADAIYSVRSA